MFHAGTMRKIIATVAWACVSLLTGSCQSRSGATQIDVGYTNTISFLGLFIAKDRGMFAKRGLDVKLTLIALNSTIPSAILGGSIQIGGTSPPVFLQAVEGGIDLVVIAGVAVNEIHNRGQGVVARAGLSLKVAKDFEGRRVGVPGLGAYMHVLFRRWLTEHGADDRKVNFVEVPLAQSGEILRSGNVDAVLVGEPFFSHIIRANSGYLVAPYLADMPDGLFTMYFASDREWSSNHAVAIKRFREALDEAIAFQAADPAQSRQILSRITRLPPDVIASVVLPTLKLTVPATDLQYWSDTLLSQGITKAAHRAAPLTIN